MPEDVFRSGERAGPGDRPLLVLCLDRDEATLAALTSSLGSVESVEVRTVSDPEDAYSAVRRHRPDCIVVDSEFPGIEWHWLGETVDAPVVVYTDTDLTELGNRPLEAADTFVQKRGGAECHQFLLEKIRGTVESNRADAGGPIEVIPPDLPEDLATRPGLFLVDEDDRIQWSNRPFEEVFPVDAVDGTVPESDALHRKLAPVLDNDPELTREVLTNARTEPVVGVPVEDPVAFYRYDRFDASAVDGERLYLFEPVTDVVDRYDDADLFEGLVENVHEGLYVLNADAELVYCNDAYAEMFGYDREELLGEHTAKWMAPGELQKGQRAVDELLSSAAEDKVVDLEFRTADGERITRTVHFTLREREGGYGGLLGVVRRPVERDREEAAVDSYRPLLADVSAPKLLVAGDGTVRVCNDEAADVLGTPAASVEGQQLRVALADVPNGREFAARVRDAVDPRGDGEVVTAKSWVSTVGPSADLYDVTVDRLDGGTDGPVGVVTLRRSQVGDDLP